MSTTTVSTTERSGGSVGASAGTPAAATTDPITHRSQTLADRGQSHDTSQPTPAQRPRGSVLPSPSMHAAEKNTVRVRLDDMDLPNSVHRESESYRLRLSGKGAIKVSQMDICIALASNGIITLEEWDNHVLFYRLADMPFERFIHINPDAGISLKHNSVFSFNPATQDDPTLEVECSIENLSMKQTTLFLQFVPITFEDSTVTDMLTKSGLEVISLKRDLRDADKWVVTVKNELKKIPHYIEVNKLSKKGDETSTRLLVTVPGRLTECSVPGCRSTAHRANKCPLKQAREKSAEQIQRDGQRKSYSSAAKGWKNMAKAEELLRKENVQPKASDSDWTNVSNKRKNPPHTIRQEVRLENRYDILGDYLPEDDFPALTTQIEDKETPKEGPLHSSTPITRLEAAEHEKDKQGLSAEKRKTYNRAAKTLAKISRAILKEDSTQKKKRQCKKATPPKASFAIYAPGKGEAVSYSKLGKLPHRKINRKASGEPRQTENESGSEWETTGLLNDSELLSLTPLVPPARDPEVIPESQHDTLSDAARGHVDPGGTGPTKGWSEEQVETQKNIQNVTIVHHDSM